MVNTCCFAFLFVCLFVCFVFWCDIALPSSLWSKRLPWIYKICALMSVWRYSTLNRSVHSYSTLFLKHEGQISVEVTGKRRKTMRIKRICRCVDGFGVGTNNEHLTLKLFYCYRLKDFDSCWSVSHFSVVTCWHLYVILGYIIHLSFWVVFFIRGLRYIEVRYIEVLSHTFYYIFSRAKEYR